MEITITKKKYDELQAQATFLECLNSFGVDNWTDYCEARSAFYEENPEFKNIIV